MIKGHGGNIQETAHRLGCRVSELIDMSSNLNPVGPPPGLIEFLRKKMGSIVTLPDADSGRVSEALAGYYEIDPERIIAGNGTTQFIYTIPRAVGTKKALIIAPTYADYADACTMNDAGFSYYCAGEQTDFNVDLEDLALAIGNPEEGFDTVFICNPNNPTGVFIEPGKLAGLCRRFPETVFVVDESYLPFAADEKSGSLMGYDLPNVIILNSMSKIFRIPGLRIGFCISSKAMAEKLEVYAQPWSVNSMAQAAILHLMKNKEEVADFISGSRRFLETEKRKLSDALKESEKIRLIPGSTIFILARLAEGLKADQVCEFFLQERMMIRNCANFKGLTDQYIRFSLNTPEINRTLAEKLLEL